MPRVSLVAPSFPRPRRRFASTWLVGSVAVLGACNTPPDPRTLNVVVVTLDTTRADRIGAFGGTAIPTPNLDRAASEGTRFTDAVSPVPITLPSHASLFTGRYPFRHGVRHNGAYRVPDSEVTLTERLKADGLTTGAFVASFVLNGSYGLSQGFDTYSDLSDRSSPSPTAAPYEAERSGAEVNEAVFQWIDTHAPERFFLWVHYYDPHHPYEAPSDPSLRLHGSGYDREVSYVDHCFGKLVDHLKQAGVYDRTLLVVAADHGESLGSHGELTHGIFLYEPAIRVPVFVRAPGLVREGGVWSSPVSLVDIAPMILELLGLEPLDAADGVSPLAAMGAESDAASRVLYAETMMPRIEFGWSDLSASRGTRFKFVRAPRPELYDLRSDPLETTNLFSTMPDVASELAASLDGFLGEQEPEETAAAEKRLSPGELARLQSLGYLTSIAGGSVGESGGDALPDPKDHIGEGDLVDRAQTLLDEGDFASAARTFEAALATNPGNHNALQGKARAYLRLGRLDRAEDAALAALAKAGADPKAPKALVASARSLLSSIRSARGARTGTGPGSASPVAALLAGARSPEEASALAEAAVRNRPDDPWAWAATVEVGRRAEDAAAVRDGLRKMVALGPKSAAALVDIAERAREARQPRLARDILEAALVIAPDHPDVLGYVGTARLADGDLAGAEVALRKARSARPEDPRPAAYLANIELLRGREREAKELIQEALRANPEFTTPLVNYARWLREKGRTEDAKIVLKDALRRRPGDTEAASLAGELGGHAGS